MNEQDHEQDEGESVLITLGADGRVYFHDLPLELLPVAGLLAPEDEELRARLRLLGRVEGSSR